jgi:hypothetical protein
MFFVGVDLGQLSDFTAIAVVEGVACPTGQTLTRLVSDGLQSRPEPVREMSAEYHVRRLERPALGQSYVEQVDRVVKIMGQPALVGAKLIVDGTGVGVAVCDLMRARGLKPIVVSITGGESASVDGPRLHVPKRDLAGVLQAMFGCRRIRVARGLELGQAFVRELQAFSVKVSKSGHDTYEALRESDHDDLVLAVSLAVWYAERVHGGVERWTPMVDRLLVDGSPAWCAAKLKARRESETKVARKRAAERDRYR